MGDEIVKTPDVANTPAAAKTSDVANTPAVEGTSKKWIFWAVGAAVVIVALLLVWMFI